jgi:chemotaxis protein MotB
MAQQAARDFRSARRLSLGRVSGRRLGLIALAGVAVALGGCVSQQDYDSVLLENRTLKNRNQELQAALDERESALSALGDTRRSGDATIGQLQSQLREKDELLNEYESRMRELERQMQGFSFGALDPVTDAALADLAARHSNLLTYDSERGMLRFASDLTFASGSDQVSDGARATLRQLATILQGSQAAQYDLIIVGHTDSQPISAATAQRHPTNMHLSCHRAIAVQRELVGLGLSAQKIQAAGWGEHRPLVPNTPSGNTPANRRVEVYIGRSVGGSGGGAPAPGGSGSGVGVDRQTPPARQQGITK